MRRSPFFTGYNEYRNGTSQRNRRPVYEPGKAHRTPLSAGKREHVVAEVTAILKTWTFSPFEHEAAVRHGLRQALCIEGSPWQLADDIAADLVREGLRNINARRPTWIEGQWHYTTPRENCSWCGREIEMEGWTRASRFCSAECARAALAQRGADLGRHDAATLASAYRTIHRSELPARPCKACGKMFKSHRKAAEYCSPKCVRTASSAGILADIACKECGTMFHPKDRHKRFCSHSCAMKNRMAEVAAALPDRECKLCGTIFHPTVPHAAYCSDACKHAGQLASERAYKQRRRELSVPVRLTPLLFDAMLMAA